ncbi:MAG TPA: hypothetical protein DCZ91_06965 [Lachnospiraceae bacterium]|nr:hypothetical protein [Lachnospiraceae bacterium]
MKQKTKLMKFLLSAPALLMLLLAAASCGARDIPDSASGVSGSSGVSGDEKENQEENQPGQDKETSGRAEGADNSTVAVSDFYYMALDSALNGNIYESFCMDGEWLYLTDIVDGEADEYSVGITRRRISDGYTEQNYALTGFKKWKGKPLLLTDGAGNCYLYWCSYAPAEERIHTLEKYGTDGAQLWSVDYTSGELDGVEQMLDRGTVTADGRVFLYQQGAGSSVFSFGADGSLEQRYTPELDFLEGVAAGKDGRVYAYYITGEEPLFLELGGNGEQRVCPTKPMAVYDGFDMGLCLRTGEGMFSYDPETGGTERLWGWGDEYIQADGNRMEKSYAAEGVLTVLYMENSGSSYERQIVTFASIHMEDAADYPERRKLLLTTQARSEDFLNSTLSFLIQRYNRQSRQYRVEVQFEQDEDVLVQKLLRGEGGDLVDLRMLYADDLARMGAFEELDACYEGSAAVSREDILESVWNACSISGKNVSVIPGFQINTLRARGDFMAGEEWTVWKFLEMGEQDRMFSSQTPDMALGLCMGLQYGAHFVDYEKKECYFDTEEFRRILESCRNWETYTERVEGYQTDYSSAKGDWLFDSVSIASPWDIVPQKSIFDTGRYEYEGDDYVSTLVGFPGWDGGEYQLVGVERIAMTSSSEHREGAWDFLEYLLSEDLQKTLSNALPSRKDCFNARLSDIYVDPASRLVNTSFIGGEKPELQFPTEEDISMVRRMAESAVYDTWASRQDPLWEIVSDEAAMYFAGDADLEETVQKIQNRVQNYLNEL